MPSFKTYDTERLFLRPIQEQDAEFILELFNAPKFIKYVGKRNINSVGSARKYIQDKMLPQLERSGFSNFTIITKKEHQKIGTCGLFQREGFTHVDIGYALLPEFEKKGFASEAARKIISAGFEDFGFEQINAYTTKDNLASQNLLIALGFKQTGTTFLPNDPVELLKYQIHKN